MFIKKAKAHKTPHTVNLILKKLHITLPEQEYVMVYLTRGSHKCQTQKPQKVRKGICNLNKQTFSFECTLFLDRQTGKYLEKLAELKIKECSRAGEDLKTVARLQFDVAEYANYEQRLLEIEFEFDKCQAKLEADIEFIRNEVAATEVSDKQEDKNSDDVKSVKTEVNGKVRKKSFDVPNLTTKKKLTTIQQEKLAESKDLRKEPEATREDKEKKRIKSDVLNRPVEPLRKESKNIDSLDEHWQVFRSEKQPKKQMSQETSTFLLKKELESKNKQIERLKDENANLHQVIDRISKQPTQSTSDAVIKLQKLELQNKSLKTNIVQKDGANSQLQLRLRASKQREEKSEQAYRKLSKECDYLKHQLQNSKSKIAALLQGCYELGDSDLISFVQKHLDLA